MCFVNGNRGKYTNIYNTDRDQCALLTVCYSSKPCWRTWISFCCIWHTRRVVRPLNFGSVSVSVDRSTKFFDGTPRNRSMCKDQTFSKFYICSAIEYVANRFDNFTIIIILRFYDFDMSVSILFNMKRKQNNIDVISYAFSKINESS